MLFRPVVACAGLPKDGVATSCFVEVCIDAFKLQVGIAVARTRWTYTGFSADYIAELGSNFALSV